MISHSCSPGCARSRPRQAAVEGRQRSFMPGRLSQSGWRRPGHPNCCRVARRVAFGLAGMNAGDSQIRHIAYGDGPVSALSSSKFAATARPVCIRAGECASNVMSRERAPEWPPIPKMERREWVAIACQPAGTYHTLARNSQVQVWASSPPTGMVAVRHCADRGLGG